MSQAHPLERAISIRGLNRLARDLDLTHQALRRWQRQRRLPRTEWTGETAYAQKIAEIVGNAVTKEELLTTPWPVWPEAPAAMPTSAEAHHAA